MYCAKTAMLSAAAARVRNAACSAGKTKRVVAGSTSTTPAGDHGSEPLAHVALIEPRLGSDLCRGRWRQRAQGIEKTSAMTDRDHQTEGAMIERSQDSASERFSFNGIEISLGL